MAIEIVRDDLRNVRRVQPSPVTSVRFGLWDGAYDPAGSVINAAAESQNFVGDRKRPKLRTNEVVELVRDEPEEIPGHGCRSQTGPDKVRQHGSAR